MKPSPRQQKLPIKLNRNAPKPDLPRFTEYFQGFEKVGAVRTVFGDETERVLSRLRIGFIPNRGMYMGIRDSDGNIAVGTYHLRNSPTRTLYLDVVHELFHINQRMTNEKFFHDEFMKFMQDRSLYYASPIEIPAYQHTVREAERIGMSRKEIIDYLKMSDAPPKVWRNFLKEMRLKDEPTSKRVTRFPVKVKRETTPRLYRFFEYFKGFEKVSTLREIFGESTDEVLGGLKVEFIDSPFPGIYTQEDDGHLVVSRGYFREGKTNDIYLDVFLCLNTMKRLSQKEDAKSAGWEITEDPAFLESYAAMVNEARRIGMPDKKILNHVQLMRFLMKPGDFASFLRRVGLAKA